MREVSRDFFVCLLLYHGKWSNPLVAGCGSWQTKAPNVAYRALPLRLESDRKCVPHLIYIDSEMQSGRIAGSTYNKMTEGSGMGEI